MSAPPTFGRCPVALARESAALEALGWRLRALGGETRMVRTGRGQYILGELTLHNFTVFIVQQWRFRDAHSVISVKK